MPESETKFLGQYDITKYERPSVTADIVALMVRDVPTAKKRLNPEHKLSILLIRRGEHPYKDKLALPGGFLHPGESIEQCAARELKEETGVPPVSLMHAGPFTAPDRDPRGWIISNAFISVFSAEDVSVAGGDDASDARWYNIDRFSPAGGDGSVWCLCLSDEKSGKTFSVFAHKRKDQYGIVRFDEITGPDPDALAFDHWTVIASCLYQLRERAKDICSIFDFFPGDFTVSALQRVYEIVTGGPVSDANFRRKVMPYIMETGVYTTGSQNRPSMLYRRKEQ